jgi:hypothetical protein
MFGRLEGSRMKKRGFLAMNPRKGGKKGKAVRIDLHGSIEYFETVIK